MVRVRSAAASLYRKFTQIIFGSVLFEVSSVQLRQLRLRHGTQLRLRNTARPRIGDREMQMLALQGRWKDGCAFSLGFMRICIHKGYTMGIYDGCVCMATANQQIRRVLGVLEFSFDFLNPVTKTKYSVLIQF